MSELADRYREVLDAFNRRDVDAWLEIAAPEVENHPPVEWPESAVTTGAQAVWDFLVSNFETFDAGDIEISGPIVEGDGSTVAPLRADVRGPGSGVEIEWAYQQVAWFREGRLVRLGWFNDRDEAMAAAGIRSSSPEEPG